MYNRSNFNDSWGKQNSSYNSYSTSLGNPSLTMEDEKALRRKLTEVALKALETPVEDQTVFEVK